MTATSPQKAINSEFYSGKISLKLESDPPTAWFASFELQGNEKIGSLSLASPIGTTIGNLRWDDRSATVLVGSDTQQFISFEAALLHLTGASVSAQTLFLWLAGKPYMQDGWQPDLSQFSKSKVLARRISPLPAAQLTFVLSP